MIVGYVDTNGAYVCALCWQDNAKTGRRADSVLTDEPADQFWTVDTCEDCGQRIEYVTVRLLD